MNDVIRRLVDAKIRFILIGGHAVRLAGYARYTQDWDLFIPPHDLANIARINKCLEEERDLELLPLGPHGEYFIQTFQFQWVQLQFHLGVPGVPSYDEAEAEAVEVVEDGVKIRRLSGRHLLASKEKADRPSDQNDIYFLRKLKAEGKLV